MAAKLCTKTKRKYTSAILTVCTTVYYLPCAHDITEHIQAQLKPESACKRNWLWYNSVNTVKPCKTYNRCAPGFQGGNHGSWDAYAFRTPVPALNAKYLPPNVFMNTCHGENRAAAALYHAGGLGSTRVVWHTCRRLYACPTSQCAHVRTVTMQARQHLGDSHTHTILQPSVCNVCPEINLMTYHCAKSFTHSRDTALWLPGIQSWDHQMLNSQPCTNVFWPQKGRDNYY